MRYRDAGVDVSRSDAIKTEILAAIRGTWTDAVRPLPGGFAGIVAVPPGAGLVAATIDGVGTKLLLAQQAGRLEDAAADLVFHGANDLLVHGARPLAFLDYVAQSRLEPGAVRDVVRGLARGCRAVGAALVGGETAEMPDTYLPGAIDVAGCMLGTLATDAVLDGSRVRPGDVLLGIASAGLHTNGYSLARAVLARSGLALADQLPGGGGESVGDALLAPHRTYAQALPLAAEPWLHALAHVTGGGIAGNLARVLPEGCRGAVRAGAWPRPALFRWLADAGAIPEEDAREAFNLGVGLVAVVAPGAETEALAALAAPGVPAWTIGRVTAGDRGVAWEERPE